VLHCWTHRIGIERTKENPLMNTTTVILMTLALLPGAAAAAEEEPSATGMNLAPFATPGTSFVSGHETLSAINDGFPPQSVRDHSHGCYGNWPQTGTQWVQYTWSQPVSTARIDVYWWDDARGVRLPTACRLSYWDGGAFAPVQNAVGLGVAGGRYNTTTFDQVTTTRLRLEFDGSENFSTGIIEWKVSASGKLPKFPPRVTAGNDRVVVLPGRTYLDGVVQGPAESIAWSKAAGPGEVTFSDAQATATSATFSQPGDYTLCLTGKNGDLEASSVLAVQVVLPPPETPLTLIDTKHYRIDSPLWNHRAKALIAHWIPHCIAKISDPDLKEGGINNFVDAANKLAGKPHGAHRGYVFSNAWVYNTIESMCVALMIDAQDDQEIIRAQATMRKTLDDWIPTILAAQEQDGYIQTYFTLGDHPRWSPRLRGAHEGYVAGYFLEAAIAHYWMTDRKDTRLYDAATRLADCWCDNIGPPPKQPWYDGHQAMEIALVRFGRFVNQIQGGQQGDKYIGLAKFLLDNRDHGSEYDQSHVPVIQQYEAVGHAVRASYSYAAMSDVAMETGDADYQSAVMSLWDNIVNRKYYVTGGIGSGETSEGFGPDYSLRHDAYCESCSSCGEIFFQHKLHLAYHDAKYVDLYEETLYNALLGSIDLPGENFYYQNPLDTNRVRYDWHACPCCVGNIPRTLLMLPTWTYSKSEDGIWINLFVGSAVTVSDVAGTDVELVQETDYPWSGQVSITVDPAEAKEFAVRIRLPKRSVSELYACQPPADGIAAFRVNGQTVAAPQENGYAVLRRVWKAGDTIDVTLPMQPARIHGSDKIDATRGQVALRYGPLIYCVESVDQAIDKTLPRDSSLQTQWRGDLLGGVQVITGEWSDGSPLLAIPYYARQNRPADPSGGRPGVRSSVWIDEP
jgi:DUF1680 family protein